MPIVKVQRPIASTDAAVPWLLYDKRRSHETLVPDRDVPDQLRALMGSAFKAYFVGKWTGHEWLLQKRVEDQPW